MLPLIKCYLLLVNRHFLTHITIIEKLNISKVKKMLRKSGEEEANFFFLIFLQVPTVSLYSYS